MATLWSIAEDIRERLNEIESPTFLAPGDGTGEADEIETLKALERIIDREGI